MNSDETLNQSTRDDAILQAIAELSKKIDGIENKVDKLENKVDNLENKVDRLENKVDNLENKVNGLQNEFNSFQRDVNAQFETIREGIVHNSVAFDRLQASVFNLSANLKELTEEVRQNKKVLA